MKYTYLSRILLRVKCFALCLLLFCTPFDIAAGAEENTVSEKSVLNSKAFTALKRMSMTAENSEFNSDDYMTRKDFAYILARVAGYESGYRSDRGFSDLSPDDMTAEAVSYLANIGVVSGTGNGAFRPEDYITHLQAAKMAVTALGFSDIVRAKYPNNPMGYVILANELKLFGGYGSDSMNLPVSCRDAVEILFKTAQCPIASPETYSGGSVRISRDESETLLSRNHNIYKSEGIMTDNGITSLDGKTSVRRGGAVIGDVCLTSTSEGSSFENFIGERVEFWYNEKEQKLLYAYSKQNDSDILRIDYDELLPENDGFNITGVVYRKGSGSVRTAKISPVHKFIYNGSSYPSHSSEDLKISAGYMELIDINGDDIFDIIRVNEYTDDVIHYIDVEEGFIKTKYHELMLKTADWKNISVYMPDGTVGSVYELALNQPVSLLLSKDRVSLTLIDCSKRAVTGKLSAADIDGEKILIDSEEYKTAKKPAEDISSLALGESYTFYRNADGAVFAVDTNAASGWTMSYCVNIGKKSELTAKVQMRVITAGNKDTVYTLNKKIKVNGDSVNSENLLSDPRFVGSSGSTVRQPLRFKFDDLGNVSKIEVAVDNTDNPYHINLAEFSKDYAATGSVKSRMDSAYIVACTFLVVPGTNIFVDPYLNDPAANGRTDGVECLSRTDLKIHSSINECVIYDLDEHLHVSAMVTKSLGVGKDAFEPYVLTVGKYTQVLNDDGEYVGKIQGVAGDSLMNWSMTDDCLVTGTTEIKPGYVFNYRRNREGRLTRMDFVYDLNDQTVNWTHATNHPYNENMGYLYSPVYSASENGVVTIMPVSGIERGYSLMGTAFLNGKRNGALYDRSTKEVKLASGNDIYGAYVPNNDGSLNDDAVSGGTPWIFIRRRNSYSTSYVLVIN